MHDVREYLKRLVADRGDSLASLSRVIGRNAAYLQQFIERGTPRQLPEDERLRLAQHFQIDERLLGVWIGVETGPRLSTMQVIVLGKKPQFRRGS